MLEAVRKEIGGRECLIYDCGSSDTLLIQPVDDHDIAVLDSEVAEIVRLTGGAGFTLAAFRVIDWNDDLSPWEAPAVFGDKGFGGGAESTLEYIEKVLVPGLAGDRFILGGRSLDGSADRNESGVKLYIGGYSLAAFFALWAAYQTEIFSGAAAASPSVWFPGWIDYAEKNEVRTGRVYLSLGDKEERTRNPVMRTVGDNLRRQHELLSADPRVECTLEMNQGNHFKEADLRTAKGFAWLLGSGCGGRQTR